MHGSESHPLPSVANRTHPWYFLPTSQDGTPCHLAMSSAGPWLIKEAANLRHSNATGCEGGNSLLLYHHPPCWTPSFRSRCPSTLFLMQPCLELPPMLSAFSSGEQNSTVYGYLGFFFLVPPNITSAFPGALFWGIELAQVTKLWKNRKSPGGFVEQKSHCKW